MGSDTTELRGRKHRLLIEALYSYGGDREDRLTEVLASLLEVNPEFCACIARRLGLRSPADRFAVQTQVGLKGQRRLIDLVMTAVDVQGSPVATILVECKYNPTRKFGAYWFTEDQAVRQRRVLDNQPGQGILAGICSKGDFKLLDGPLETRPPFDPRSVYDPVLTWSEIRDLALSVAGTGDWEKSARSAGASLAERALLEFITYVDLEGDTVGALADDDAFVLARYAQSMDRIDRLLWRAGEDLAERMDAGAELEFDSDSDDDETTGAPRVWIASDAPETAWVSGLREGGIYIMITGAEYDDEEEVGTPTVYAGVAWNAGRAGKKRTGGSNWERAANNVGLRLHWEGTVCNLLADRPLQEFADSGNTIARQADALATWAHESISAALCLPSPPDADQDENAEEE